MSHKSTLAASRSVGGRSPGARRARRATRAQWRKWRTPGHEHRRAGRVDGRDHLRVAHRAARLDERASRRRRGTPRPRRGTGRTHPRRRRPRVDASGPEIARAFSTAWRAASTRLVWPVPSPTSRPSRTRTIAFDVTPRTSRQARSRSRRSASVGARGADDAPRRRVVGGRVGRGDEDGAAGGPDRRQRVGRTRAAASSAAGRGSTTTRRFGFAGEDRQRRGVERRARRPPRGRSPRARSATGRDRPAG